MAVKPCATHSIRIASLVVMTLWLAGCSSLDHAARNGPIPQGKSIVFGSISAGPAPNWFVYASQKVTVINTHNSQPVLEHPIKGLEGYFYWCLPPGQYAILDLQTERKFSNGQSSSRDINAKFSIDSEQTVVYLGKLGLASSSTSVIDEFDTAVQAFHSQFPAIHNEPIKQLMYLEKRR